MTEQYEIWFTTLAKDRENLYYLKNFQDDFYH